MWALTKPPCQITYHWTPFHPANLHYPDQMSLGFLLHSVFWIICLQKRSSMSWSRLAPCDSFPTKTICSLCISTFNHLIYLCVLNSSLFFIYKQPCSDYPSAWCLCLGKEHSYFNSSLPLSTKSHLGQRLYSWPPLRPTLDSARKRKSVIASCIFQFQMTII